MNKILEATAILLEASSPSQLFKDGQLSKKLLAMACADYISRDVFYGRCIGFQVSKTAAAAYSKTVVHSTVYAEHYA